MVISNIKVFDTEIQAKYPSYGSREAPTKSILSHLYNEFAVYRPTTADNALLRGGHVPPKTMEVITNL